MKEITGDLWEQTDADAICVTTNGTVKKNGCSVVGRGCAKEADEKFPNFFNFILGQKIHKNGNNVYLLFPFSNRAFIQSLVSFPVKNNWWEKAELWLIEKSAHQLVRLAKEEKWKKVIIPRPGCGNGQRSWEEVKAVLEPILDDRFCIISPAGIVQTEERLTRNQQATGSTPVPGSNSEEEK